MKNILFILLFISIGSMGQGITTTIFIPGQGWVSKKIVDSSWVGSQISTIVQGGIADASITNAKLSGSIAASKLIGTDIVLPESQITNLSTDLSAKAPLASPTFTGTVTLPSSAVTNAMLAGSIAYSKLNLTGAILNTDLAGSIAYSKLNLTGSVLNADLAGSIAYSKLSLSGAILNTDLAGSIAYSKLSLTGSILNADLAGNIVATKLVGSDITLTESQTTNLVTDLGNKQGISTANTTATTGTITTTMTSATQNVFKITPTGACTFNASGGKAGAMMTFIITTSGTSSFVLTWSTNFRSAGTLSTGTVTAKKFCVSFICEDGTVWEEVSRTIAM